jgi:hypothetical protein
VRILPGFGARSKTRLARNPLEAAACAIVPSRNLLLSFITPYRKVRKRMINGTGP